MDLANIRESVEVGNGLISSFCISATGDIPAYFDDLDDGFETDESIRDDCSDCEDMAPDGMSSTSPLDGGLPPLASPNKSPEFFSICSPGASPKNSQILHSNENSPLQCSTVREEGSSTMEEMHMDSMIALGELNAVHSIIAELRSEVTMLKTQMQGREEGPSQISFENGWRQEAMSLRADVAEMQASLTAMRHELAEEKRGRQRDAGDFSKLLQRLRQWTETQIGSFEKRLPTTPSCLIQKNAEIASGDSEDAGTSRSMSEATEEFDVKLQHLSKRLAERGQQQQKDVHHLVQTQPTSFVKCPHSANPVTAKVSGSQMEALCQAPTKSTNTSPDNIVTVENNLGSSRPKVKSLFGCGEEIRLMEATSPRSCANDSDHSIRKVPAWHTLQSVR